MSNVANKLTLAGLIRSAAKQFPDQEAVVAADGRFTYAQIDQASDKVARALSAAGIGRGDHVGICAGNTGQWVELFYGIAKVGAVIVPINTRLKPLEIQYQLGQAQVKLLFLADRLLSIDFLTLFEDVTSGLSKGFPQDDLPYLNQVVLLSDKPHSNCIVYQDFLAQGNGKELPAEPGPRDPALIQYTSGTTSLPKGAMLANESMVRNASAVAMRMGLERGHRYLSARPFFHVAGTTLSIAASASVGATLVTMARFVADDALDLMEQEECSHFSGNDTMFLMLLERPNASEKSKLIGGWAAASPAVIEQAVAKLGTKGLVVAYGLSEASPNVAISDQNDPLQDRIDGWMRPHAGLEVRIANPDSSETVAAGQRGEIQVRGWSVMLGYFGKPKETAEAIGSDGFLRTGDMGIMREDGCIRFLGRIKEIIRVGGENVSPSEIEDVLVMHPAVAQAQVVGFPDPRLMEVPVAYVTLKEGHSLTVAGLLEWLKPQLAGYKMPREIAIVETFDDLGLTASGKVQKTKLVEDALIRFAAAS